MSHLLLNLPIEVLSQITSYLVAHDIIWKLGATGDNVLLLRLRNGGVIVWNDDGQGDSSSKSNFARRLNKLATVTLELKSCATLDRQYVYSLPSTIRHLVVHLNSARKLFDLTTDPSTSRDSSLQPLGLSQTAENVWVVRETFPNLELLHLLDGVDDDVWSIEDFSLVRLLRGLPASLQDFRMLKINSDLNIFDHLPPNLTKLHNVRRPPSTFAGFASLSYLELRLNPPVLPPHLTHLVLSTSYELLVDLRVSLPPSLTRLEARTSPLQVHSLYDVLECLPLSITSATLLYGFESITKETLQQLEAIQPLQKLKCFKLSHNKIDAELESSLWSQLLRLVPNVEELSVHIDIVEIGVEPKHLKMLNPNLLRSLTLPMSDACFYDFEEEPSYLPRSLTKLIIQDDWSWNFSSLLTPQSLPYLKTLQVPYLFDGLEAFNTLENLTSCHQDGDNAASINAAGTSVARYPPNLTRLSLISVIHTDVLPTSITRLKAQFNNFGSFLDSLPSLQTLIIYQFNTSKWTFDNIPTTLTHLALPFSSSLRFKRVEPEFFAPLQRLSNLLRFDIDARLSLIVLDKIFGQYFPPQAILKCKSVAAAWSELNGLSSRIDGITGPPFAEDVHSCAYLAVRRLFPRLKSDVEIKFNGVHVSFTPALWSILYRFLAPSTTHLALKIDSLGYQSCDTFPLPSMLQSLRLDDCFPGLNTVLASLPPSLTHLKLEYHAVKDSYTNWPPRLKYLYIQSIIAPGAESLRHLPSTLEHLGVGRTINFNVADYLLPSFRCFEALVSEIHVAALLEHTQQIGCLWVTNLKSKHFDYEIALDSLVSLLQPNN